MADMKELGIDDGNYWPCRDQDARDQIDQLNSELSEYFTTTDELWSYIDSMDVGTFSLVRLGTSLSEEYFGVSAYSVGYMCKNNTSAADFFFATRMGTYLFSGRFQSNEVTNLNTYSAEMVQWTDLSSEVVLGSNVSGRSNSPILLSNGTMALLMNYINFTVGAQISNGETIMTLPITPKYSTYLTITNSASTSLVCQVNTSGVLTLTQSSGASIVSGGALFVMNTTIALA